MICLFKKNPDTFASGFSDFSHLFVSKLMTQLIRNRH